MAKKPKNGLTRGKAGYAVNFFRSDILVNLQLDLKRQEKHGIDETTCSHIRFLLSSLVSAASAEPKASLWGPAIHVVLREYEKIYKTWNDVRGEDEEAIVARARLLEMLQDTRQKISKVCRNNAYSLSEDHDLALVSAINDALLATISVAPAIFTSLARSATRFSERT